MIEMLFYESAFKTHIKTGMALFPARFSTCL